MMRKKWVPFAFFTLLAGCGGSCNRPSSDVNAIENSKVFEVLEKQKAVFFRNQDWCKVLRNKRGNFASNDIPTCTLQPAKYVPFTPETNADLIEITEAIRKSNVDLFQVDDVKFDDSGAIESASFSLNCRFCRESYVYHRSTIALPNEVPGESKATAINQNWYRLVEDWM